MYVNILLTIITINLTIIAFYTITMISKDYVSARKTLMRTTGRQKYYQGIREKVDGT